MIPIVMLDDYRVFFVSFKNNLFESWAQLVLR